VTEDGVTASLYMNPICANCRIACDIISSECRLRPEQVARVRLDLIKNVLTHYERYGEQCRRAAKAWRLRNPERRREIVNSQYQKHKDGRNARKRARRAKLQTI
jgi:hypothetical protein